MYAAAYEGALHLDDILARRTRISIETWDRGVAAATEVAAPGRPGARLGRGGGGPGDRALPEAGGGRARVAVPARRPLGRRRPARRPRRTDGTDWMTEPPRHAARPGRGVPGRAVHRDHRRRAGAARRRERRARDPGRGPPAAQHDPGVRRAVRRRAGRPPGGRAGLVGGPARRGPRPGHPAGGADRADRRAAARAGARAGRVDDPDRDRHPAQGRRWTRCSRRWTPSATASWSRWCTPGAATRRSPPRPTSPAGQGQGLRQAGREEGAASGWRPRWRPGRPARRRPTSCSTRPARPASGTGTRSRRRCRCGEPRPRRSWPPARTCRTSSAHHQDRAVSAAFLRDLGARLGVRSGSQRLHLRPAVRPGGRRRRHPGRRPQAVSLTCVSRPAL